MNIIYYEVIHKDGVLELYSVVETNFGGDARNFVKSAPLAKELHDLARSLGWINLKEKAN